MMTDRPYRPGATREHALLIIAAKAGTQFDPEVVDAFLRVFRTVEPAWEYAETA